MGLLVASALCLAARAVPAETPESPYQEIIDRNVFNIRPPAPPNPDENKPPPPKITLQGITTILGNKRALLKCPEPPKPGQPAQEEALILAEGQRDGDIEVLEIDEKGGTVKVNNHGVVQTLDFASNGEKAAPRNPFQPGVPGLPSGLNPGVLRTIPTRTLRLPALPAPPQQPPGTPPLGQAQGMTPEAQAAAALVEAQQQAEQTRALPPVPGPPGSPNPYRGRTGYH